MRKFTHLTGVVIAVLFVVAVAVVATWAGATSQLQSTPPSLPSPSLKELAKNKGIELGNYAALKRIGEPAYADILTNQFSFATIDGEPNWQFNDGMLRPGKNEFNFTNIDKVLRFAQSHNMPVRMQHLVWGEEKWLPEWLTKSNYSKEQLLDIMRHHIEVVGGHYKGQVREWTVVNEAFTRSQHQKGLNDWWADHAGQEYISQAFSTARKADPDAKLIMNDFNNEDTNAVSDAMYDYIKGMKSRGIPIDGIGMQMHIDGSNPPKKEEVIKNMQRFAALGLGVYVTEFDVNMNDFHASGQEVLQRQASVYHDMLRACIESKVCKSFSLLGITDKETWYNELGIPSAIPLPFDRDYQPKPAFWAMREALSLP